MKKTYKVPKAFYLDHLLRDCGKGDLVVNRKGNVLEVELDEQGYNDLLSDAEYYWSCRDMFDGLDYSLFRSAKTTFEKLVKAGSPNDK